MTISVDGVTGYRDDDLTFFALVYKDYEAVQQCLADLRKHYTASRVILRSDGDPDPRYEDLAERHDVHFRCESRLFTIQHGGAVIERMFELFFEKPTRFLFKIDPDTVLHRRMLYLPDRSGIFGTPQGELHTPSIQGGCMGFSRVAAEDILRSAMLRDARLREPANYEHESPYFIRMAHRAARCGLASFDWGLSWIASELGIPMFAFDEISSGWQQPPGNDNLRYAVTHPRAPVR